MSKIEKFLDKEAQKQADIDELHEEKVTLAVQRIDELLLDPRERDPEIFELLGAPIDETFDQYFDVPELERDLLWAASLSALATAARMQSWLELYGVEALAQFQQAGRDLDNLRKQMSHQELKKAALKGIGKARINGEKAKRKSNKSTD